MLPLSLIYGKSSFGNGKALEKFVMHRANQIVGSIFLGPFRDAVILDFTIHFGSNVLEKCVALEYLPKMRKKIIITGKDSACNSNYLASTFAMLSE